MPANDFLTITPLDGRNYRKIEELSNYFSEFALNRRRLEVEIKWLMFLLRRDLIPGLSKLQIQKLEEISHKFDLSDMESVRSFERKTNHDVKAVEYFLKQKCRKNGLRNWAEFVHWGLTSEDINNLSLNLNLKDYLADQLLPLINKSLKALAKLILSSKYPMLGRTHGRPAEVTVLGKELAVFLSRFKDELKRLSKLKLQGKLSGAVGSFTDQYFCFPQLNWPVLSGKFVKELGLEPALATTQILPYDSLLAVFSSIIRLQNIAIDLCQNLWWYLSLGYFVQKTIKTEVGSSVMPQKINPIYLEGAEGGFELAGGLFEFYIRKLSRSRLQRDLSDSTVRRSFGIAFGYSHLSWQSLTQGLSRLKPDPPGLKRDLENHWEIMAGPVQNYLRLKGFSRPYEILAKELKGKTMTHFQFLKLISRLKLEAAESDMLKKLSPEKLIGPSLEIIKNVTG
jgi:adenylosuccinate lyase